METVLRGPLTFEHVKTLHHTRVSELPIVARGQAAVWDFIQAQGLQHRRQDAMLWRGYYAGATGDCYFVDLG